MSKERLRENIALISSQDSDHVTYRYDTSPYKRGGSRKAIYRTCLVGWFLCAVVTALVVSTLLAVFIKPWEPPSSSASSDSLSSDLQVDRIVQHLKTLQEIADNTSSNSRSVENAYNSSAEFVAAKLIEAGYDVKLQPFPVTVYETLEGAELNATLMSYTTKFLLGPEFSVMRYSGSGERVNITLDFTNSSGCDEGDFDNSNGKIVLIIYDEGNCTYYERAQHAKNAQAAALIMMRDVEHASSSPPTSRILNTSNPNDLIDLPVFGATYQLGQELVDLNNLAGMNLLIGFKASTVTRVAGTYNVLGYSRIGKASSTIVVGSHLDSVPAGPGINDNGSGSAVNLELALLLAQLMKTGLAYTESRVLFAFWGAEELGLLGSHYYVSQLGTGDNPSKSDIALNLNFDMVGSPNFIRGVYNGSGAESEVIRNKCRGIQKLFEKRFSERGLLYHLVPFDGRSDYGPFIAEDTSIPAGGLFTGAEGIKTTEDKEEAGGVANAPYDPCYHQACDTINNVNVDALRQMSDAAAYVLQELIKQVDVRAYLEDFGKS